MRLALFVLAAAAAWGQLVTTRSGGTSVSNGSAGTPCASVTGATGAVTADFTSCSDAYYLSPTGTLTITLSGGGSHLSVYVKQGATPHTVTIANLTGGCTISATANKYTIQGINFDGATYTGDGPCGSDDPEPESSVSGPYFVIGGSKYLGQFAFPVTVPPTLTILNTAGLSTCTPHADGSYTLAIAPVASDNLVGCGEAMGANTSLTVAFNCNLAYMAAATVRCGFGFRESGTQKLSIWEFVVVQGSTAYGVATGEAWTNQTTSGGHVIQGFTTTTLLGPVFFGKAYFSGANICFQVSNDGISYTEALCEAKTTAFTVAPDQWFVFGSSGQTTQTLYSQILSFQRQ